MLILSSSIRLSSAMVRLAMWHFTRLPGKRYRPVTEALNNQDNCFLPNFCGLTMVFVVVMIAQLFAFVVVLIPNDLSMTDRWQQLGLVSLFVQWCALVSCAVLCVVRKLLVHLKNLHVAMISYVIVLLVVYVISTAAYWYVPEGSSMSQRGFVLRNVGIALLLTGPILRYFYVRFQWDQKVRAEAEARLQALQSRIRPHFLFNSLNTIASLTRIDAEQAETAVENLADLFRVSLRDARQFHTFHEEYELCQRYLAIEALRLGERLKVEWDIDDIPDDAYLPPLLIQPLLENAISHGIEPKAEGGTISIKGNKTKNRIILEVSNPVPDDKARASQGNQIAQENIRARLKALYESKAEMELIEEDDRYSVKLTWPYRNKLDEDIDH